MEGMSVIVELTADRETFALGRALRGREIELERIVPVKNAVIPFFWSQGGSTEKLERQVRESTYIENLVEVDRIGDRALYRVEWTGEYEDLVDGIASTDAVILDAYTQGERWLFRLRFPDHENVATFYNFCTDHEISVRIERVTTLTEEGVRSRQFGLTNEQREALVLALRAGYFETPRETTLADLAADLDISQQALSDRIRRGNRTVLGNVLLSESDRTGPDDRMSQGRP